MALSHPSWTVDTTFSGKDISSAASVYTFTAAADGKVQFTVKLTNAAGNGDYIVYLKRQWLGAGTASVVLPKTTCAAASGETVVEFVSMELSVKATDVVDVMIDGLAGDTSVSGAIRISADNPSVFDADNDTASANVTMWKDATAPAMTGDAYARLGAPAGASVSADIAAVMADTAAILVDTGTTLPTAIADLPTASEIDTELSGTHGDGSWEGGASGAGTVTWTYTLTSSVDDTPIADADVWVTTDAGGSNVIASGQTDQYGQVEFELDPGTIYVWRQKSGWNFSNPDTEVVV